MKISRNGEKVERREVESIVDDVWNEQEIPYVLVWNEQEIHYL